MASLGHIAVGLAAARLYLNSCQTGTPRVRTMAWMSALALLPDADVISFKLGIPYHAPFGHRGASHSFLAALVCGLVCVSLFRVWGQRRGKTLLFTGLFAIGVVASHGVLVTLTNGGLAIALLWPFTNQRFFAPWRPIPVAPIGIHLLSEYGVKVMLTELLYFLPLFVYALWPRRRASVAP